MEGHLHPLSQFMRKVIGIFDEIGFEIIQGPELEIAKFNFDLLNIPKEHPARDEWDTFYIKDGRKTTHPNKLLLRTHTSPVQIRAMQDKNPPVRIIVPGRCFRQEATDRIHETSFYQLEGLAIDKNVSMKELIGTLDYLVKQVFGEKIKTRVRPSYFPFTEPSMELDMLRDKDWEEVLGAGMVHPKVLKNMKINPDIWQGFAFGLGIDRLAMLYYGIDDIRLFYGGDLRFIKQF